MADFTLFRGRVIQPSVANLGGGAARVTLALEDYNGLFDRINVGAPDGEEFVTQPDGTDIAIDPAAVAGTGQSMINLLNSYWRHEAPIALVGPDIDDTYIWAPSPPGTPILQWYTDLTTLRQALDDTAARVSGAVRYHIDPDLRPHWREFLPSDVVVGNGGTGTFTELAQQQYMMMWPAPDPAQIVDAPFALGPIEAGNVIMPMTTDIDWDYSHVRYRVYVRGSTLPGSGWNEPEQISTYYGSGEEYIDAPGSIYKEDKNAIIAWYAAKNLKVFLVGTATIPAGHDGWRAGQTVLLTERVLALFQALGVTTIENRPLVIQSVTGTLKAGGQPIGVRLGVINATTMVSKMELTWTETFGEAGTATCVLELLDESQGLTLPVPIPFAVPPALDVEFWIPDGTSPIIEYTIEFGDRPAGFLSRQLAKIEEPPPPAVVYKFKITIDDPAMPDGGSSPVKAQLTDGSDSEVKLAGVPMEWVQPILQFEDNAQTVVGTLYTLADDVGTTDAAGAVFSTITRSGNPSPPAAGDIYNWRVQAVALPIE